MHPDITQEEAHLEASVSIGMDLDKDVSLIIEATWLSAAVLLMEKL